MPALGSAARRRDGRITHRRPLRARLLMLLHFFSKAIAVVSDATLQNSLTFASALVHSISEIG